MSGVTGGSAPIEATVVAPTPAPATATVPPARLTGRWVLAVVGGALVMGMPWLMSNDYYLGLLILSMVYAVYGIGYDVQMGYAGLFNLGHAMFFGFGAYTAALLSDRFELTNVLVTLPAAVLVGAASAAVLGALALRREGPQLAMISLGVAQIAYLVALNEDQITNGPVGMTVSRPSIGLGSATLSLNTQHRLYFTVLVVLVLAVVVVQRLMRSRLGSSWLCVRENMVLARSQGVRPFRARLAAMVVGGGFGAAGGALFAYHVGFLTPDVFSLTFIVTALVVVLVGGSGTTYGPILGAVLFTLLPEYLRFAAEHRLLIFGAVLAVVMLFMPEGLWPLLRGGAHRLTAVRRGVR